MAKRHMKRCSTSLLEKCKFHCKCKNTMKYNLTPVRMVIIKKSTNNRYWGGYGEKGNLLHCQWQCKYNHCREQYGGSLRNLKLRYCMTLQSHSWDYIWKYILGIYPEKNIEGYMHPKFQCSSVYNSQDTEAI